MGRPALPVEIARIDGPRILEDVYRLRVAAWRARVPHFPAIAAWSDAFDAGADHWGVFEGPSLVAAARLTVHDHLHLVPNPEVFSALLPDDLDGPIAVLTRLVVAPSHAGRGLSRLLDQARIAHAAARGCRHVLGSTYAGQKRLDAMNALGFRILGEAACYQSGPLKAISAAGMRETAFIYSALEPVM